ncbi:hypothetical protein KY284_034293 [Solanum tuberosum]|nr:hypothetical protein KY284_034293 [Solanum tuberosum]
MAQQIMGTLFQEGTSQTRPPYFNGKHFSHWKVRMETFIKSYDVKVWRVIKLGDIPIPTSKNSDESQSSVTPSLENYTNEQMEVIQINSKAKNVLYNAISGEEYEKISCCYTAKEMWDKLEVTYEGTDKVKETIISLLVYKYELFQMKEGETIEGMFARLIALESMTLNNLTYDEVRGNLITFEKTYLRKKGQKDNKKKIVAFKANQEDKGEDELAEDEIALITRSVMESFRRSSNNQRGRNFGKGKYIADQSRNDGKCYECGKYGHIASECPEAKNNHSRGNQKNKALSNWSDEDNSENEHEEIGNICFMAVRESSKEVSSSKSSSDGNYVSCNRSYKSTESKANNSNSSCEEDIPKYCNYYGKSGHLSYNCRF